MPNHSQNLIRGKRGLFFQPVQQSHAELNDLFLDKFGDQNEQHSSIFKTFLRKNFEKPGNKSKNTVQCFRVHWFNLFEIQAVWAATSGN